MSRILHLRERALIQDRREKGLPMKGDPEIEEVRRLIAIVRDERKKRKDG